MLDAGAVVLDGAPRDVFTRLARNDGASAGVRVPEVDGVRCAPGRAPGSGGSTLPVTVDEALAWLGGRADDRRTGRPCSSLRDVSFRYAARRSVGRGRLHARRAAGARGRASRAPTAPASRRSRGSCRACCARRRGRVTVDGLDTARTPVRRLAAHAGYVAQNPNHQLFASTVAAELAFGPRNLGLPAAEVDRRRRRRGEAAGTRGRARPPPVSPRPGEAEAGDDRVGAGDADAGPGPRRADDGAGPPHVRRHRPPDPGAPRCRDGRGVRLPRRAAAGRRRRPARGPRRRPRDRRRHASRRVRRSGRNAPGQAPAAAGDAARAPARRPGAAVGGPRRSTRSPGRCAKAGPASPPRTPPDDLVPAGSRCAGLRPRATRGSIG